MAKTTGVFTVLMIAGVAASVAASPFEGLEDELRREARLHLAREPLSLEQIRDLSSIHDVIALEKLDEALRLRLELRQTLGVIAPRELDQELVETLLGIEKLDPDVAGDRAREMLERLPSNSLPASISRHVLARRGDISVIREALTFYFEAPEEWGRILGDAAESTDDPRLRDFSPPTTPHVAPLSLPLFQTVVERTLAGSREKWKLGELLFWAEKKRSLVVARLLFHMPEGTLHEEWVSKVLADFAATVETAGGGPTDAIRLRSLAALGWRGSKNRAPMLLQAIDGEEPLAAAVSALALGRMGLVGAQSVLREKALSDEPHVASAAVAALMELEGREEALNLLARRTSWSLRDAAPVLEVLDGLNEADAAVIEKIMDRVTDSGDRFRLLRFLAERDDVTLTKLDLEPHCVDLLFPYLSRSSYGSLRVLVLETGVESRGAAFAALLLSPTASRAEKMEAAKTLGGSWPEAVVRGGSRVIEALHRLEFWKHRGKEAFSSENVTSEWIEAMSMLAGDNARKALERVGTVEAIGKLAEREDRLLALPALSRFRREGDDDVREAADMVLLSLGAPGASILMEQRLGHPDALRALVPHSNATPHAAEVLAAVAVGDEPRPDVQASLFAFYQDRPQDYSVLLDIDEPSAHRRVHSTLALSDNPARLPVLMDVAAVEKRIDSRRAALRGLADAEPGRAAFRLHRSAGDPDRGVRFAVAAALVPSGEVWAMRLMMAEMSLAHPWERLAALKAIQKLPREEAESLLEELFWDGTGNAFSSHLLFEMVGGVSKEQEPRAWEIVSTQLDEDPYALLIAARLGRLDAVRAVIERIE